MPCCKRLKHMATIPTTLSIKRLFPHSLNVGWPCNGPWPTECGQSVVWCLKLGLKRSCSSSFVLLEHCPETISKEVSWAYGGWEAMWQRTEAPQPTASTNCQTRESRILIQPCWCSSQKRLYKWTRSLLTQVKELPSLLTETRAITNCIVKNISLGWFVL